MDTTPNGFVVVGFDGSDQSAEALRTTIGLAHRLDVDVRVVVAWSWPTAWGAAPATYGAWSPDLDAEEIRQEALAVVGGLDGADRVAAMTAEGGAAEVLVAAAEGAEILVVGNRGRGGFRGLLLGSVSAACVQLATCPVLVCHDRRPATAEP